MKALTAVVSTVLLFAAPLGAQQSEADTDIRDRVVQEILAALDLPRAAEDIRETGVPDEDVAEILVEAQRRGMTPNETVEVLESSREAVEDHGPVENFGAFVQAQLDSGLRGRDLAAAIRAEHESRGIGQGKKLNRRPERGRRGQGRADDDVEHADDHDEHEGELEDADDDHRASPSDRAKPGKPNARSEQPRGRRPGGL